MRIVQQFIADDGREFTTEAECAVYEQQLPTIKLLAEVEVAIKADAAFASRIEALGTKLARERRERGDLRRLGRKPARQIGAAQALADEMKAGTAVFVSGPRSDAPPEPGDYPNDAAPATDVEEAA